MLICTLKVSGTLKGQKRALDPLKLITVWLGIEAGSSAGTSTIKRQPQNILSSSILERVTISDI